MRQIRSFLLILALVLMQYSLAAADDKPATTAFPESKEYVRLLWKASHESKLDELNQQYDGIMANYQAQAQESAVHLNSFPLKDKIDEYKVMNDVATAMFIKAEALMTAGKNDEAKALFAKAIESYPWAQSWDPSRGGYWSIKEKSQASIRVLNGESPVEENKLKHHGPKTEIKMLNQGTEKVIDYTQYGHFLNAGTKEYHYALTKQQDLVKAVGEGIYPNIMDLYKNPEYKKAVKEGRLKGSHWDYVNTPDLQAAYFKWATAEESWGVRLFYLGIVFEKAKMYYQAIKCYQALIVHFPGTIAWTYWTTPWYPGQAAIAKIKSIIREHPELKLEFKGAKISILNSSDNDAKNDVFITNPGTLRLLSDEEAAKQQKGLSTHDIKKALGKMVKSLGKGKVRVAKYANGHWQLLVNGKPYLIKGITYAPTKIGQSADKGTISNWMGDDFNKNGSIDGPHEAFMDWNKNNIQDADEPSEGDFSLMQKMGVNTLRIYHQPHQPDKELLRRMYKEHGFMVIMGDFLGKYTLGSGAAWADGTDYENAEHRKNMMASVKKMVTEFKNEPYILMWLLGNENNYGVASNADKKPDAYYKFVNDVAKMIKAIDPNHPVTICNGDTYFMDKVAKYAPEIDAYGANVYRGDYGFGSFWQQVHEVIDRPAFITEYGAPASGGDLLSYEEAQEEQARYHKNNWLDIYENSAGFSDGFGNAIGGIAFEWLDEWWKNYEPALHDTKADAIGPFVGGYYYEEWFGLLGQGNGKNSPYLREPRKVYEMYKKLWH